METGTSVLQPGLATHASYIANHSPTSNRTERPTITMATPLQTLRELVIGGFEMPSRIVLPRRERENGRGQRGGGTASGASGRDPRLVRPVLLPRAIRHLEHGRASLSSLEAALDASAECAENVLRFDQPKPMTVRRK